MIYIEELVENAKIHSNRENSSKIRAEHVKEIVR